MRLVICRIPALLHEALSFRSVFMVGRSTPSDYEVPADGNQFFASRHVAASLGRSSGSISSNGPSGTPVDPGHSLQEASLRQGHQLGSAAGAGAAFSTYGCLAQSRFGRLPRLWNEALLLPRTTNSRKKANSATTEGASGPTTRLPCRDPRRQARPSGTLATTVMADSTPAPTHCGSRRGKSRKSAVPLLPLVRCVSKTRTCQHRKLLLGPGIASHGDGSTRGALRE